MLAQVLGALLFFGCMAAIELPALMRKGWRGELAAFLVLFGLAAVGTMLAIAGVL